MRTVSLLVATALLLAGCSGQDPSGDQDDEFQDVETGPDTGAISGVVVDATITPIEGATITLQGGTSMQSKTDGTFVFKDLDPGVYFVSAEKAGYAPVHGNADVKAGEVAKTRLLLPFDDSPAPFHATQQFSGHMVIYGTIASFALHLVLQEAGLSICDCEWDIELAGVPEEIIFEGQWEDSIPDPQGPQEYYLEVFDSAIDDCLVTGNHASGFRVSMTDECTWQEARYRVALTGPSLWVALEQSYELFVTPFYGAPAPAGWGILNGDT